MPVKLVLVLLVGGLTWFLLCFRRVRRQFVPVLLYHYFTEEAPRHSLEVTTRAFTRQLRFLQRMGFHVLSFREVLRRERLPQNAIVITADDGDISVFEKAVPLLHECRFPVTTFLVVGSLTSGHFKSGSQWRKAATWQEAGDLLGRYDDVEVGCHSWSHRTLTACDDLELNRELELAKQEIESLLGIPCNILAYPHGVWNAALADWVRKAGYTAACATTWGDPLKIARFQLEREPISASTNMFQFGLKAFGFYSFARNLPIARFIRHNRWKRAGVD